MAISSDWQGAFTLEIVFGPIALPMTVRTIPLKAAFAPAAPASPFGPAAPVAPVAPAGPVGPVGS